MTDERTERLERRLQTEPMPDESRFVARSLPATVAEARAVVGGLPADSSAPRLAFALVATVAAIVLALALLPEGILNRIPSGEGPVPGSVESIAPTSTTPGATPTPMATDAPEAGCPAGSVVFRPEPWGGAAGSRGTSLVVVLAEGATPCQLDTPVGVRILDGSGTELVAGASQDGSSVLLEAGAQYTVGISWSNWCDPAPQPELRWDVRFGDGEWIDVIEEVGTSRPGLEASVPVPPCMGEGGTNLSVTDLQPAG